MTRTTPTTPLTRVVPVALALLLASACASRAIRGPATIYGTLYSGSSAKGSSSDGSSWGLSLVGGDVILEVDGAEARFEAGAPLGKLEFEHVEAEATWRLDLASGIARCEGHRLEVGGVDHVLESGTALRFDASGAFTNVPIEH